ncbi:hypothetical protein M0804_014605 [Polistes exclamans]|nr:hypothetical protein M0804_014605 [Polistes exclamans]
MATVIQANLNHARRAQDLLGQRMREIGADIAIVSKPYRQMGGLAESFSLLTPSENLNRFSRLLDELEELLGTFPALPALVAGDFNARFPRWDPEGRSYPRGELLCMWANRLNLSLANQGEDNGGQWSCGAMVVAGNRTTAGDGYNGEKTLFKGQKRW